LRMSETVVCTATHPVDLADGRSLAPGQSADDVSVTNHHNKALVEGGSLTVLSHQKKEVEK
jgi:hypothetical protein